MENEKAQRRGGVKRIHGIISGDVVGVGLRSWVRKVAVDNHLNGWVKNREDKTVELVAEGEQEGLEKLIATCKRGPDVAWVERVDIQWSKATGEFVNFEVIY